VFRYPTLYSSAAGGGISVAGLSQETGVGTPTPGTASNPLQLPSAGSGLGLRYRTGSTSDEVNSVAQSTDGSKGVYPNANHVDGIGYTFFSYGNVSPLADSTKYGYLQLNGVDPIFQSYAGGFDPGQPASANGEIPGGAETIFPKCENTIWGGGLSFPNVRAGLYPAWSLLRLLYAATNAAAAQDLITSSNKYAVTSVPDYIPYAKITVAANGGCGTAAFTDPGFPLLRSHYQQRDGADDALGKAPVNAVGATEAGGDQGGFIIPVVSILTQATDSNTAAPLPRPKQ
jgi:hypothetical protein